MAFHKGPSSRLPIVVSTVALLSSVFCLWMAKGMSFSLSMVTNVEEVNELQRGIPSETSTLTLTNPKTVRFRRHISHLLSPTRGTLGTVIALRRWARAQQSDAKQVWQYPPSADSGKTDPEILLQDQHAGRPGACRRFAWVLTAALLSAGVDARVVTMANGFDDHSVSHVATEAWIPQLRKWVLADATFDTMVRIGSEYASLLEFREALLNGNADMIRFERNGSTRWPSPSVAYYAPISKHVFFSREVLVCSGPRGPLDRFFRLSFAHLTDEAAGPYPAVQKLTLFALSLISGLIGIAVGGVVLTREVRTRFARVRLRSTESAQFASRDPAPAG
jgi:hypothetical protein